VPQDFEKCDSSRPRPQGGRITVPGNKVIDKNIDGSRFRS
jgi:hypothetical protein